MTSPQAILIGALLIAGSILIVSSIHPAEAQRTGPFMLEKHSNSTARPGVFRLDTATGDVGYCYVVDDGGAVACKGAAR